MRQDLNSGSDSKWKMMPNCHNGQLRVTIKAMSCRDGGYAKPWGKARSSPCFHRFQGHQRDRNTVGTEFKE